MRVLESFHRQLGVEHPVLDLTFEGAIRKLTLQGRVLYDLSVWCSTCSFLFERLGVGRSEVMPTTELSQRLREGMPAIDDEVVTSFSQLLPSADYVVSLLEIDPTLVFPGDDSDYFSHEGSALFGFEPPFYDLPGYPRTPYYRAGGVEFESGELWGAAEDGGPFPARAAAFGFLAPTESITALDANTLHLYRNLGGSVPTAVAMSVLDVKSPALFGTGASRPGRSGVHIHWCWTHLLLDGHHKVRAASLTGRPITLLSFTAVRRGSSIGEQIDRLIEILR